MASLRAAVPSPVSTAVLNTKTVAASVSRWLLDGPAQQTDGTHIGGVAGCVDIDGRAAYVYPEITGYFLQWLAWMAHCNGRETVYQSRAEAALDWLARWLAQDRPLTRVYLDGIREDWRNDAVFTFDLAMVLREIGSATRAQLISPPADVIE